MSSHSSRSFLNSCVKVPIDPCNNCPAPIYNRPRMFLGRLTATPMRTNPVLTTNTATTSRMSGIVSETPLNCTGIRSLVRLYDSIPDYCDINHLSEEEFYTTLNTLRSTCQQLKTKSTASSDFEESRQCSSLLIHNVQRTGRKSKKFKAKKSISTRTSDCKQQQNNAGCQTEINRATIGQKSSVVEGKQKLDEEVRRVCSSRNLDLESEMNALQKKIKAFEKEMKCSSMLASKKSHTKAGIPTSPDHNKSTTPEQSRTSTASGTTDSSLFRCKEKLHNDVQRIKNSKDYLPRNSHKRVAELKNSNTLTLKSLVKHSNYFIEEPSKTESNRACDIDVPKIVVKSPRPGISSALTRLRCASLKRFNNEHNKKLKSKVSLEDRNTSTTHLSDCNDIHNKQSIKLLGNPTPVHPVARPNLAATLRAEASKKKVKDMQSNCTYHDKIPQFDWEVRRTPAWKSLSYIEPHKQILDMRLATRKAEQALQEREYTLNMELMRQRVKSAPLLLEGTTFWGPHVGKLSHTCQAGGFKHLCESNHHKQRRRSSSCSNHERKNTSRTRCNSADGTGYSRRKSQTKCEILCAAESHRSPTIELNGSLKQLKKKSVQKAAYVVNANDSSDDLSSLDRGFL